MLRRQYDVAYLRNQGKAFKLGISHVYAEYGTLWHVRSRHQLILFVVIMHSVQHFCNLQASPFYSLLSAYTC